ncbi:uncharacterized protein LOC110932618 [Helianthus annuus]|nr:uncharacterized protein LOC110932618 [Helianthus annuus]
MTLAKSVLGSLPSYFLSLFAAPKCIIHKLEKIRRDFVWGKSSSSHKLRWIRWEFIMKAKKRGGMGLGAIQNFNWAMLAKWWWRFNSEPNQLWAQVIGAIHRGNGSVLPPNIPVMKSISGIWKDIGSVSSSLAKVGISFNDFLIRDGASWKWRSAPNGNFAVKQVRFDIESFYEGVGINQLVFNWNSWAPSKANYLLWRGMLGKVASRVGLSRRGVHLTDVSCPRCGLQDEDSDHIFVTCLWARSIWWNMLVWMRINFPADIISLEEFVSYLHNQPGGKRWKKIVYTVTLATVWRIWKARNEKVFEDRFIPVQTSVELIKEDAFLWLGNRSKLQLTDWIKWKSFDISEVL